jgi:hypothetical protein
MKYTANIEGIQAGLVNALEVHQHWATVLGCHIEIAKDMAKDIAEAYFIDDLEPEGTVQETDINVYYVTGEDKRNNTKQAGILVECDALFPEGCVTDRLTFRHVVVAE